MQSLRPFYNLAGTNLPDPPVRTLSVRDFRDGDKTHSKLVDSSRRMPDDAVNIVFMLP
jgi:hypothetical protein